MDDFNGFKIEIKIACVEEEITQNNLNKLLIEFENNLEDMIEEKFKDKLFSFGVKTRYIKIGSIKSQD